VRKRHKTDTEWGGTQHANPRERQQQQQQEQQSKRQTSTTAAANKKFDTVTERITMKSCHQTET
jgi:hypothetical protein